MSQTKPSIIILVLFSAAISGIAILFSISKFVNISVSPLSSKLNEIAASQRAVQERLISSDREKSSMDQSQTQALLIRVDALEKRLASLEQKTQRPAPPAVPDEDFSKVYDIPIDHSYVRGNADAPVTIVEFADFQCPFCSRFHKPVQEVLKAYPQEVRYILKNLPLPFHPQARPAAKAALAAGEQGKYYEMADELLENQRELSDDKFKEIAKSLGLNVNKFVKDFKDKDAEWERRIDADLNLAQAVDARGTPTFYLNGKKTMARDLPQFKVEIDKILAPSGN